MYVKLITTLFLFLALKAQANDKQRARIEELINWRISDTLKLDLKREKRFSIIMKEIRERKKTQSEKIDSIIADLKKSKNRTEIDKNISNYKKALEAYSRLHLEEILELGKIFSQDELSKYIVMKNDFTKRIADYLAGSSSAKKVSKKKFSKPQIIEE